MTRFYVQVQNGQVMGGPNTLSTLGHESPNVFWSKDQMKRHGYFEVSIQFDPSVESIDMDNPVITGDAVTYNRIPHTNTKILTIARKRRIQSIREMGQNIVFSKHPIYKQLSASLGLYSDEARAVIKAEIKSIIDAVNLMESEINAKTTREEIENYNVNFPTL